MSSIQHYSVTRLRHNQFQLHWPHFTHGVMQVTATLTPRLGEDNRLCQQPFDATNGEAVLELPPTTDIMRTVFFHFEAPDGTEILHTDRLLPFEKAANFRDFGGYHTSDGGRIRWQMLYRSGHLGELSKADQQLIHDLNIGLICDFRTQREAQFNPSRLAATHQPRVLELQVDPGDNLSFAESYQANQWDPQTFRQAITQGYKAINQLLAIDNAATYQSMLHALLEHDGPSLIHCSAGKDRTGFGAALILSVLGVPETTIMEDYLLTNRYVDVQKSLAWYAKYLGTELDPVIAEPMFGVQADYLQTAFDHIEQQFGGMTTYIRDVMGLSASDIQALRKRYLE